MSPHVVSAGLACGGLEDSRWPHSRICCLSWNGLSGWGLTRMTGCHFIGVGWNHSYVWNPDLPPCVLLYPHGYPGLLSMVGWILCEGIYEGSLGSGPGNPEVSHGLHSIGHSKPQRQPWFWGWGHWHLSWREEGHSDHLRRQSITKTNEESQPLPHFSMNLTSLSVTQSWKLKSTQSLSVARTQSWRERKE